MSEQTKPAKKKVARIKRIKHQIMALTLRGLEDVCAKEIRALGGQEVRVHGRTITYMGDRELLYKSNYLLRTAIRILKPIYSFQIHTQDDLYHKIREYDWPALFNVRQTFAIDGAVHSPIFPHSRYFEQLAKDAIVDRFRHDRNARPSVERDRPDFRININLFKKMVTVSLDSSGEPLNQRGYRSATGPAPLNECLAAAMVLLSGWQNETPLVDPMCGSGTLATEAALFARNIPPGFRRSAYGFQKWPDYKADLWQKIQDEARANAYPEKSLHIYAGDQSEQVVKYARENMRAAGVLDSLQLGVRDFFHYNPPRKAGVVLLNPPYGERMKISQVNDLYAHLGEHLQNSYTGYKALVLSSNEEALDAMDLEVSNSLPVQNGPLDCLIQTIDL